MTSALFNDGLPGRSQNLCPSVQGQQLRSTWLSPLMLNLIIMKTFWITAQKAGKQTLLAPTCQHSWLPGIPSNVSSEGAFPISLTAWGINHVSRSYAVMLNTWTLHQRFCVCFLARGAQSLFKQMQKLFWNNNAAEFSKEVKQESFSTNPVQA